MLSANEIEDIKTRTYAGIPSPLEGICEVYPPTMREIIKMGITVYNNRLGTLLLTEDKITQLIKEKTGQEIEPINPLVYLLMSAEQSNEFYLELQRMFATFITEEVLLLPKINSVLVGPKAERRLITPENFKDFQDILSIQNMKEIAMAPPKDETPGERKMRLLREKVAETKRKQAQKKGGEAQNLSTILEIADCYGIEDYLDRTLYSFYKQLRRRQAREKWDQDYQALLAGADNQKLKSKYWGETLDE